MERHLTFLLATLIFASVASIAAVSFAAEGKWTLKTDMPTARLLPAAEAVNGKIYVIGGWNEGPLSTVEEYDPATDTWTTKANMPTARKGMATCVVDGKIYAFGGLKVVAGLPLRTVEMYDPATDTWTPKADMPIAGFLASVAAVEGKIYVIGGFQHTQVHMYDPVTDAWERRADTPAGAGWRHWAGGVGVVDGKIYVFGGATGRVLESTWEYDPAADGWARKANMPVAKWYLSVRVLDGKLHTIGGNRTENGAPAASTEVYDPEADTWTEGVAMQTARGGLATAVVDGKIYAVGGATGVHFALIGTIYATVEEYDPNGASAADAAVSPQGKKPLTWGEIKQR